MQTVTITSQGQVTIPKKMREYYGITQSQKVTIENTEKGILVRPKKDFWSLAGSLKSGIVATDTDLRKAREKMLTDWPRKLP